ncbi:hypothetical protein EYC80_003497 [Monilinia laxa]|uniref:Uncharacterized protein n=1 Tax=Monilinia laxa TaxID=61186 RepID=A0A5N6KF83_MONLA|nr:hypothetical protein EYC80_003497 [Monilinia laxa]
MCVQNWLKKIEAQEAPKIKDPSIPVEIIFRIIEESLANDDLCTATCLALTAVGYWNFFRRTYPYIILLNTKSPVSTFPYEANQLPSTLAFILRSWFGPAYRFSDTLTQYLLCSSYGDNAESEKEWELINRTRDYHKILSTKELTEHQRILPNPFGMGDDWHLAAIRQFVEHVEKVIPDIRKVNIVLLRLPEETKNRYPMRETLRMSDVSHKNRYSKSTMMHESYLWKRVAKYVKMRVPNWGPGGGVQFTRERCFWEAVVQASKQDWEKYFLINGGVKVPRINR